MAQIIRSAKILSERRSITKQDTQRYCVDTEDKDGTASKSSAAETLIVADEKERQILEYANALEEAERKISSLEKSHDALNAQLENELASAKEEGYQAGLDEGLIDGRRTGRSELADQKAAFEQLYLSLKEEMGKVIQLAEDALVETVFVAAGKIVGDHIKTKDGYSELIIQALKKMDHSSHLQIRVSPEDYDLLSSCAELALEVGNKTEAVFIADEHVSIGGCILENEGGVLDARLEIQLHRLKETLLSIRDQRMLDSKS